MKSTKKRERVYDWLWLKLTRDYAGVADKCVCGAMRPDCHRRLCPLRWIQGWRVETSREKVRRELGTALYSGERSAHDAEFEKQFATMVLAKVTLHPRSDPLEIIEAFLRETATRMPGMSHSDVALLFFRGIWHGAYADRAT